MGKHRFWTEEEITLLHRAYSDDNETRICELLDRSERAIETKAYRLGLIPNGPGSVWTNAEISILREYYLTEGGEVSRRLPNRNIRAVFNKASKLGLKGRYLSSGRAIDETGHRYGKLTVLGRVVSPSGKTDAFWLCRCDCGNLKNVSGSKLRQGYTTSCGCKLDHYPKTVMKKYIRNAKRRGIEWSLSFEQFITIIEQECHYCGVPFSYTHLDHTWNGIDRIDSKKGYVVSNVVPCCKICNKMKSNRDSQEFLGQCLRIAAFQTGVEYG